MNRKGLTFAEILISVLIISIVLAGLLGAFVGGHQLMDYSRHRIQALDFAREALAKLRTDINYQYTSANLQEGPTYDETGIITDKDTEMADLDDLSLTYTVDGSDSDPYKEVTINVNWSERSF